MSSSLDGEVVWITGASSGIGEALAVRFAERGARVVLSARRAEELERVRQGLAQPERHLVVSLDLGDEASLRAAVGKVLGERGAVDVMVHNGGISQRALARETGLEVDRRLMEIDYFGAVDAHQALLPAMRERGGGRFVVVSSLVGRIATPLRSGYAAAKHALHGFFEALRAEEHAAGIRVTMVCPGFIRTRITYHALTADGSAQGTLDRAQAEGMDPVECARRIVAAVEAGRDEVLVGGKERFAVYLWRLAPWLFRRIVRRARVT